MYHYLGYKSDFEIFSLRLWGGTLPLKIVQMIFQARRCSDTCPRVSVSNLKSISQLWSVVLIFLQVFAHRISSMCPKPIYRLLSYPFRSLLTYLNPSYWRHYFPVGFIQYALFKIALSGFIQAKTQWKWISILEKKGLCIKCIYKIRGFIDRGKFVVNLGC